MLEAAAPLLPDNTGGALLLGVDGVCMISHGSSSATAIVNAVRVARDCVDRRRRRPAHRRRARAGGARVAMPAETHSHRGPIDRAEVERIVREQLAEILEVDPDAITPDARLRDDLDADDFALIELVEAVEGRARRAHGRPRDRRRRPRRAGAPCATRSSASSAGLERRGGVVTDASHRGADAAPTPADGLDALEAALGVRFTDRSLLLRLARAPVVVRGERRVGVERAARVPRRLRARSRRDALRVRALPRPARGPALGGARRRRERARARRGRAGDRSRRRTSCSARARTRPAAARSSRSSPTRSRRSSPPSTSTAASRPRATSCCAASRDRIAEAAAGPGGRDYKTRLQELAAARVARPAPLRRARRGPRPRQALLRRRCTSATSATARAKADRRSRPSRPRRGSRGHACRKKRANRGTAMPELPEVEVMRRDLEREVVGKKIKSVEVTGHALGAPPQEQEGVHRRARRAARSSSVQRRGQVPRDAARRHRRARSCTSACRVSCCARRPRARRRRSTRTS